MNLRDVKYLIAVAETRHFGRAAERCFVSQPTLSGQIKKLENELGVTIFERTNRSVTVTPIGEQILTHARLLLEQANAIQQLKRPQGQNRSALDLHLAGVAPGARFGIFLRFGCKQVGPDSQDSSIRSGKRHH